MANSLFNTLNNNQPQNPMIQKLNQFRQSFTGDAKTQVQQLLNSGRISQQQYNQLSQIATQIQNMLMGKQ